MFQLISRREGEDEFSTAASACRHCCQGDAIGMPAYSGNDVAGEQAYKETRRTAGAPANPP